MIIQLKIFATKYYDEISNVQTDADAERFINEVGEDGAMNTVLSEVIPIEGRIRVAVAEKLIKRFKKQFAMVQAFFPFLYMLAQSPSALDVFKSILSFVQEINTSRAVQINGTS